MPRLPDKSALGGLPSMQTGDSVVTGSQYGAGIVPASIEKLADADLKIKDEEIHKRDALDVIKAEAYRRPKMMELENQFDRDPDHATFDQRFQPAAKAIDDDASALITNPQLRERFRYKSDLETNTSRNRVLDKGTRLAKQQKYVDTDEALRGMSSGYSDATDEQRDQVLHQMHGVIGLAEQSGLVDPVHAQHLKKSHIYGNGGLLYREADSALYGDDPFAVLKDINDAGGRGASPTSSPSSSIGARRSDGMATVTTGGGAKLHVNADHADRFKGLVDDLEANGVEIKGDQSGGYNPRNIRGTNTPSQHASGRAIDINWTDNAQGTKGQLDPEMARSLAAKWGLKWGGDFSKPDPMHFEVAKDAKPVPMAQRGVAAFAGNKAPDAQDGPPDGDLPPGFEVPEDDRPPQIGGGEMSPRAKRWAQMSPEALSHLRTRARTALSDTMQRDLKDTRAEVVDTGVMPVDENGRTAIDQAGRILSRNQLSREERLIDEAKREFHAKSPLPYMTDAEAQAHLDKLAPESGAPGYAADAKIKAKADKVWEHIKDLRETDGARAVDPYTWRPDGTLVRQTNEGGVRLTPAPEVARALALIDAARTSQRTPAGVNGKLFTTLRSDPLAAREMLLEARMDAQKRLAPDRPDTWKLVSQEEADAVLKMPKGAWQDIGSTDYTKALKAGADRIYQFYGPKYGREVYETAIRFHLKKKDDRDTANAEMARLISAQDARERLGEKTGQPTAKWVQEVRQGLDRIRNLDEIDRVGRLFDGGGIPSGYAPERFQGRTTALPYGRANVDAEGQPVATPDTASGWRDGARPGLGRDRAGGRYSTFSTPTTDDLRTITEGASAQANKQPTEKEITWALHKPERQEQFDIDFGKGAYARELAKRQQK